MIEIVATPESVAQAKALLALGVDNLYLGEDYFGLRLPHSFERAELTEVVALAHAAGKKVTVAVNAIFHNDRIVHVLDYLQFLASLKVDQITVGDAGAINLLLENQVPLAYLYDASVTVTSARQINFWAKHQAQGAVIAQEVPYEELKMLAPALQVPGEMLVFGATAIHQSGRPLVDNYFDFVKAHQEKSDRKRGLFISAPRKPETHYSIYEDRNGTHVFASNDIDLMPRLDKLVELGLNRWKLDGIFCPGDDYVTITGLFIQAKNAFENQQWTSALAADLDAQLHALLPKNREVDTGFFDIDPSEVQ
ncbi:peptidase U32 family protein [Latilactobacillus fuchuensis]|uniref:Peptidase, U32 family small subunit n=1 Tax=Latilactobacillus fuchuensis DSM 14340 = JCM 11249 TaxID=1423747 RepID=A0A0R1RSJ1_9LACO|nr:peptidase U32 family protein [Latilactobacillus fuchuensis]KRL59825.1 peptidase, U32 family small subunit [Latilactobacillus fuchuensis DSM 14340 = JCM 11249]